jgi:hypothetical protein
MKQLYNHTKTIFALLGVSFFISSTFGQSAHTEYFLSPSYFKTSLNPAFRPSKGYIGIPGLTNISVGYRTNTFTLDNFLFPGIGENGKTGSFLNEKVSYDQFMKGISGQNYLNLDFNETLLGFGFYVKDVFLTFDAGLRINTEANIPKDVFDFLKKGAALGDYKTYDFSGISMDAIAYGQIGLGGSYPLLNKSLLLGAKVKALLGLANGRVNLDRMKLDIRKDKWSVTETQASIQLAMKGVKPEYNDENKFDGLNSDDLAIGVNGFGLGLDLGASFKLNYLIEDKTSFLNNFTVSAAVTDLGFINWNKSNSLYLVATDPTGFAIGDKDISFDNSENIFADLEDSFEDAYNFQEKTNGIEGKTNLKAKLNWSIEYAFPKEKINVGLLSTTYFNSAKAISEYTIGGAIKPIRGLEAGLSYSFIYGGFQTVGLALHLGSFFYIASDYIFPETNSMFVPVSAKAFNLQMGFAIPIGKTHK